MNARQIELVQESWLQVKPIARQAGELFYEKLFTVAPEVRPLFTGDMKMQAAKLVQMLSFIVARLHKPDTLAEEINKLGLRHHAYGAQPGHFIVVGQCLLATLQEGLGENWNMELKEAWTEAYTTLAEMMMRARHRA